jgi:hypothetical protein
MSRSASRRRDADSTKAHLIASSVDASRALVRFSDYPKLTSWLLMHAASVPALKGLVIDVWAPSAVQAIHAFASQLDADALLVRSDRRGETGRSPRGGYVVALRDLAGEVRWFLDQGRVVFLLEPRSPFDDLYSLTMALRTDSDRWLVEVAGPGFDASDLKRGDITPHETLEATPTGASFALSRERCASQAEYERSLMTRFGKVARLLGRPSEQWQSAAPEAGAVAAELTRRRETLLLEARTYQQIPEALVHAALTHAARLQRTMSSYGLPNTGIAVSMSYLGRQADPVFWDVVWPSRKYVVGPTSPSRDA